MTTSSTNTTTNTNAVPNTDIPGNVDATQQEDTPRDVRLLHLLLASQAIHQYEDQVPLQLMDFAYRYTRGVLKDAIMYNDYMGANIPIDSTTSTDSTTNNTSANTTDSTSHDKKNKKGLTVEDIRLAIAARTQYQFKPTAPKELMLQLAADRNKKALPQVMGSWGIRLPPEKYCLTAKDWDENQDN